MEKIKYITTTLISKNISFTGSIMDTGSETQSSKYSDLSTIRSTFDTVIRAHYPAIVGHIAIRLVPCPSVCSESLALLASLNPYSFNTQSPMSAESPMVTSESLPVGAITLFATGSQEYSDAVSSVIVKANAVYNEFLRSEEGVGFTGQVGIPRVMLLWYTKSRSD